MTTCAFCGKKVADKVLPVGVARQKYCGKKCRRIANLQKYANRYQTKAKRDAKNKS